MEFLLLILRGRGLTFIKIRMSFSFFFFLSPHSLFVLPVTRRFIRLRREKPYNNFLLNRTAAFVFPPSPNSIVVVPTFHPINSFPNSDIRFTARNRANLIMLEKHVRKAKGYLQIFTRSFRRSVLLRHEPGLRIRK